MELKGVEIAPAIGVGNKQHHGEGGCAGLYLTPSRLFNYILAQFLHHGVLARRVVHAVIQNGVNERSARAAERVIVRCLSRGLYARHGALKVLQLW